MGRWIANRDHNNCLSAFRPKETVIDDDLGNALGALLFPTPMYPVTRLAGDTCWAPSSEGRRVTFCRSILATVGSPGTFKVIRSLPLPHPTSLPCPLLGYPLRRNLLLCRTCGGSSLRLRLEYLCLLKPESPPWTTGGWCLRPCRTSPNGKHRNSATR